MNKAERFVNRQFIFYRDEGTSIEQAIINTIRDTWKKLTGLTKDKNCHLPVEYENAIQDLIKKEEG